MVRGTSSPRPLSSSETDLTGAASGWSARRNWTLSRTAELWSDGSDDPRGGPPLRTVGDRGRRATVLQPHLHTRDDRLQVALLRISARLSLVVDAPVDAVRGALRRVHPGLLTWKGDPALPGVPVDRHHPVVVL